MAIRKALELTLAALVAPGCSVLTRSAAHLGRRATGHPPNCLLYVEKAKKGLIDTFRRGGPQMATPKVSPKTTPSAARLSAPIAPNPMASCWFGAEGGSASGCAGARVCLLRAPGRYPSTDGTGSPLARRTTSEVQIQRFVSAELPFCSRGLSSRSRATFASESPPCRTRGDSAWPSTSTQTSCRQAWPGRHWARNSTESRAGHDHDGASGPTHLQWCRARPAAFSG